MPSDVIDVNSYQARNARLLTRTGMVRGLGLGYRKIGVARFDDPVPNPAPNPDPDPDSDDDDKDEPKDLSGLQSALKKEREQKKELKRTLSTVQTKLDELAQAQRDAETKRQADEDKKKIEQGEFKEIATTRETERDEARAEVTRLTGEIDQLKKALTQQVDAGWKTLPKEVQDVYPGAEDDPIAKLAFIAKSSELVKKLSGNGALRGNGGDPLPGGGETEIKSLVQGRDLIS